MTARTGMQTPATTCKTNAFFDTFSEQIYHFKSCVPPSMSRVSVDFVEKWAELLLQQGIGLTYRLKRLNIGRTMMTGNFTRDPRCAFSTSMQDFRSLCSWVFCLVLDHTKYVTYVIQRCCCVLGHPAVSTFKFHKWMMCSVRIDTVISNEKNLMVQTYNK